MVYNYDTTIILDFFEEKNRWWTIGRIWFLLQEIKNNYWSLWSTRCWSIFVNWWLKKKVAYPNEKFNVEKLTGQKPDQRSFLNKIRTTISIWSWYKKNTFCDWYLQHLKGKATNYVESEHGRSAISSVCENFVNTSSKQYGFSPLYSFSLPSYSWKGGLKHTNNKLDLFRKHTYLVFLLKRLSRYPWRRFHCNGW